MMYPRLPVLVALWAALATTRSQAQRPQGDHSPAPEPPRVRVHLVVAPDGNEARYRVREQLARLDFPSDAVGATTRITGGIVIDPDGTIVSEGSRFVVDLTTLASDESRRDRYVRRNTLVTDSFPQLVLVPTALRGVSIVPSVPVTLQLVADLTVHGVTRPTVWDIALRKAGQEFAGVATTSFAFVDFALAKPQLAMLLSVKDTIRLEYDFHPMPRI